MPHRTVLNFNPHVQVTVEAASPAGDLILRASGTAVTFPGYLAAFDGLPAGGGGGDGDGSPEGPADASPECADGSLEEGGDAALAGGALSRALQGLREGDSLGMGQVRKFVAVRCSTRPAAWFRQSTPCSQRTQPCVLFRLQVTPAQHF